MNVSVPVLSVSRDHKMAAVNLSVLESSIEVLYKDCLNYAPRVKKGSPGGLSVLYRVTKNVYREIFKIFLSKSTRPRALMFGLQHHLVVLSKGACPTVTLDLFLR